jgi:hypothetical protein
MAFSFRFEDGPVPTEWLTPGEQGLLVSVTIGDFNEKEVILTGFWDKNDYIQQWTEAISRLVSGDNDTKVALATAVHNPSDPKHGYVVNWWPMYKDGESVHIRNGAIAYDPTAEPINLTSLYSYVPNRESKDRASEWTVPLSELDDFLKELQSTT